MAANQAGIGNGSPATTDKEAKHPAGADGNGYWDSDDRDAIQLGLLLLAAHLLNRGQLLLPGAEVGGPLCHLALQHLLLALRSTQHMHAIEFLLLIQRKV